MYRSSTSLLRPLQLWPLRELINLSHMQHVPNMWNDLAKAMKASDRKKGLDGLHVTFSRLLHVSRCFFHRVLDLPPVQRQVDR